MSHTSCNVAEYLFTRLRQLGCLSLHGLPGDFNLAALDFVEPSGVRWVGSCNELNAAYAADAYARVRGLGAILTTFGVGELSAINGVAGSYAELAPVVHIVGTPSRASQRDHSLLHHTLGNGDFKIFSRIYSQVTIGQADLIDPATAPAEIDRVLQQCYVESRPVYIQLPTDMVYEKVDASSLDQKMDLEPHVSDKDVEDIAIKIILDKLYAAQRPIFLIDGAAPRRRLMDSANKLINRLKIPVYVAPMGKSAVDENLPFFVGVYAGDGSSPDIRHHVESSDLIVTIGNIKSDLNTAGFTYRFSQLNSIAFHYNHIDIGYATFKNVWFKSILPRVAAEADPTKLQPSATKIPTFPPPTSKSDDGDVITHAWLWPRLSSFLREGDLLVTDTGTSYVGYWETKMPPDTQVINQILWSSIGYGVGAAQGAGLAAKDNGKQQRTICFEGDGSFQLTAQELSTIIHHDLNVTMFLIENSGYTIERFVHGLEAAYNDIPQWQYHKLAETLTPVGSPNRPKTWRIDSRVKLDELMRNEEFASGKGLQFVEIHMAKLDAPRVLVEFGERAAKNPS